MATLTMSNLEGSRDDLTIQGRSWSLQLVDLFNTTKMALILMTMMMRTVMILMARIVTKRLVVYLSSGQGSQGEEEEEAEHHLLSGSKLTMTN